jgi:hypothetical protein
MAGRSEKHEPRNTRKTRKRFRVFRGLKKKDRSKLTAPMAAAQMTDPGLCFWSESEIGIESFHGKEMVGREGGRVH